MEKLTTGVHGPFRPATPSDCKGGSMPHKFDPGNTTRQRRILSETAALQKALAERDRFLARHPHLTAYQAEIDRILDKSGDCQGRLAVLGTMMQGKLLEMKRELGRLEVHLADTAKAPP